jgi:uncharacterized protein (TIGR03435 family)
MKTILPIALILSVLSMAADGQTPGNPASAAFDAASINVNPPETGFHFAGDVLSGGPGSTDPGMFRCSKCTLATLIGKAFELENYQFPARTSLADRTFEVTARVPAGATQEEFQAMLRNLLKERFGLAYHFTARRMRGYRLVVAKNGSKLKESSGIPSPPAVKYDDQHWPGHGDGGGHNGLIIFNGSARYRGEHKTTAEIARLLSDQLSLPVEDQTGLQGKYDVSLTWSGPMAHSGNHPEGGAWGGPGHTDHGSSGATGSGSSPAEPSGPGLSDAVQEQLGLRLVPAEQVVAQVFVVDHVERLPAAN